MLHRIEVGGNRFSNSKLLNKNHIGKKSIKKGVSIPFFKLNKIE